MFRVFLLCNLSSVNWLSLAKLFLSWRKELAERYCKLRRFICRSRSLVEESCERASREKKIYSNWNRRNCNTFWNYTDLIYGRIRWGLPKETSLAFCAICVGGERDFKWQICLSKFHRKSREAFLCCCLYLNSPKDCQKFCANFILKILQKWSIAEGCYFWQCFIREDPVDSVHFSSWNK